VLALRTEDVPHHKGQICFPGGSRDAADADPCETALREAEEEMGILPSQVDLLGAMEAVHTVTGFSIRPVVALIPHETRFRLAPFEMAEAFDAPLDHFLRFDRYRSAPEEFMGIRGRIYFLDFGPYTIWGVTARILRDLAKRAAALGAG
jgi:8-oxo-dGTP pyrophosphatase MutT (NUDIX family)